MSEYRGRAVTQKDPPQPDYTGEPPEKWIKATRKRQEVLHVAGHGPESPDIMFVQPALLDEDAVEERYSSFSGDKTLKEVPEYCKGLCGGILKDLIDRSGMNATTVWYTAVVKWLLPRAQRTKPPKEAMHWAVPSFMDEVKRLKPKLVVCMGKQVFDLFCPYKIRADDIKLGIMYHKELDLHYVLIDPVYLLSARPDYVEKMGIELKEVASFLNQVRGTSIPKVETNYQYLRTACEVRTWLTSVRGFKLFAVDCEWGGETFIDGTLRTIQFSWLPGTGVAIVFRDETGAYTMDASYEEIGDILGSHMNQPDVNYVGHHYSADSVWMRKWLKLETYGKCVLDTEFAQQTLYEHVGLGLDNLAMMYTDLGKYDLELVIWKKLNPLKDGEGYARIPDKILLPYACMDTDATLRIALVLHEKLQQAGMWDYYQNIFNPFVTNVFTEFCFNGLPMDVEMLDELRELYLFARDHMEVKFQNNIHNEAKELFVKECFALADKGVALSAENIISWVTRLTASTQIKNKDLIKGMIPEDCKETITEIKQALGVKLWPEFLPFVNHLMTSATFNIRAGPMMKRWLFEVKRITPIKSTNQKEKGMPSMAWEKVLLMQPDVRKNYSPAADKQSLQIFGETTNDTLIRELLDLNAVGNILKAFLKPAEYDEDGELVKENGLHYHICSDVKLHPNISTTESSRPRYWKPNALNLPSQVNGKIKASVKALFEELEKQGKLPDRFAKYLTQDIPSIRSTITAPPGWCIVESDYKTAEIRGLAYVSGDVNLIRLVSEPDTDFAITTDGNEIRINFSPDSPFTEESKDPAYLMAYWSDGKHVKTYTEEDLAKDESGNLVHPESSDLHWSIVEYVYHRPRESLLKKAHRDGLGKPTNFSTAYGTSSTSLERSIEANTGVKPDEGTGDLLFEALQTRQPTALAFLEELQELPKTQPYIQLQSGRRRHFLGTTESRMKSRDWEQMMSAQGRECRNIIFQESVAATSARACNWLLEEYRNTGMQARPMVCLYDAVCTLCPISERHEVKRLHQEFMCDKNTWTYHDRELKYPIDTDYCIKWSTKPTKEQKTLLYAQ